ncbi:cytoskeletal protein CcmA (bactofilin family) [Azospirillum fermentarium]|uniref:bactofilin family protein n=1 Tax=Azospirillum fermentarium TaxID=1233114 RepID=UPI0022260831|nr:polymer-forming cytoskeletal protein [Azospirillum fermentarium]MCW2245035.1 cytoskeletal protein CcmA (bactofilin family) [Azospirillum fermentarium]
MTTPTPPKPPVPPAVPGTPLRGDAPRRMDIPGVTPRPPQGLGLPGTPSPLPGTPSPATPAAAPSPVAGALPGAASTPSRPTDPRRLIVGRDIALSGEIGSCDALVVEGSVEAKLPDGRIMEIAETGLFKGSVEIDEADIAGRFDGTLTVRGRLTIRATGRVQGTIRYGVLAVEAGGQISGDVQVYTAPPKAAAPAELSIPAPVPVTPDTVA